MSTNGTLLKTIAGKFKRLRFFHGMLLTETDFQEEQTYYRDKLKLHNRLHGDGVVWGLRLKEPAECPNNFCPQVTIEAGVALDCAGNEIVVCRDYTVSLEDKIEDLKRLGFIKDNGCNGESIEESIKLYIGLRYCECESKPVQQYATTCDGGELYPEFSRVSEGYCVGILTEDELPDCCKYLGKPECCSKPGDCAGLASCCEDEQIAILGSVTIDQENPYNITRDKISMGEMRKHVYVPSATSNWAYQDWKNARESVMINILRNDETQRDISGVIGMSVKNAKNTLAELGFVEFNIQKISAYPVEELDKIRGALPFAHPETTITLIITDTGQTFEDDECVLFAMEESVVGGEVS